MTSLLHFTLALIAFILGLKLSAFFSGSETGFYRASFLRLNLDAKAGDKTARRLLWFASHPSHFVATTLIGNNLANYLTTFAIGYGTAGLVTTDAEWLEIVATLLFSPLIFIFGELVPKNLYYRSPLTLLRQNTTAFLWFYRAFWLVSLPLIGLTKLLEYFLGAEKRTLDLFLGRTRLVQVLGRGRQEGILTEVQTNLINGLMQTADQPTTSAMTPIDRILGLSETATREETLQYARQYGLTHVLIHRENSPLDWFGYVRVIDATLGGETLLEHIRIMPIIDSQSRKLQALIQLRTAASDHGLVMDGDRILGSLNQRGLSAQLLRPSPTGPQPFVSNF